jgi:hypothetical protein
MSGFTHCNDCTDILEEDAYCHCCFTGLQRKVRELEAEIEHLRREKARDDE